ncbi:MAG TPA: carbohydrate-binding domain-containing protein [Draconibacterium sp.]|nr:carbohydrate-binding domain-containing protein [Draconibacterium sp.]
MSKKLFSLLIAFAFVHFTFTSCNDILNPDDEEEQQEETTTPDNEETIAEAEANNGLIHDDPTDYIWNSSDVIQVLLNGTSVSENSEKVTVEGQTVTIISAGSFSFSGSLNNGQIVVNTEDDALVRLILNGVEITSSNSAPVYIKSASKAIVYLEENTNNTLTDGSSYIYDDTEKEEPNATIFSKSNLTFFGSGTLTVNANFNDAINCKDGIIISGGTYTLKALDDGIRGKDYLIVKSGTFDVVAGGDGFKSDNDEDESEGYINIVDGTFTIAAKGDAIAAETDLMVTTGNFNLISGGGSSGSISATASAKGLKAGVNIIVDGGTFNINSADDAIHSNETIAVNGGDFVLESKDDGIHADYDLTINDGDIDIKKSYEGLESANGNITINKGTIHLVSSDDGINISGGGDSMGGRPGQMGGTTSSGNYFLYINGGYTFVNASGDGLDSNGSITMTGGTVIVNGPTNNGNGALDYDGTFKLTGGFLVAAGSSGMAQAPGTSSTQYIVAAVFSSTKQAGTLVNIQTSDGKEMLTFKPEKTFQSLVFSSPDLTKGSSYDFNLGGSSTGTVADGVYTNGTYTVGSKYSSFTISGIVTVVR